MGAVLCSKDGGVQTPMMDTHDHRITGIHHQTPLGITGSQFGLPFQGQEPGAVYCQDA